MPSGRFAVTGTQQILARLELLDSKIEDKIVYGAMFAAAEVIRDAAVPRLAAARGENRYRERHKAHKQPDIIIYKTKTKYQGGKLPGIKAISNFKTFQRVLVGPSSDQYWLYFLEYGTKRQQRTRPFLRPAFDESKARAESVFEETLKRKFAEATNGLP